MATKCPTCNQEYEMLGQHWARSSCQYPKFTDYQKEIITGTLMGDGSIHSGSKNPFFQISVINKNYLEYIDNELGILSTGVKREKRNTDAGNSIFRLNTRALPCIKEYEKWYSSGKKVWPSDIILTPTVLKHLYVCDGDLDTNGSAFRVRISMSNQIDHREDVENMFKNIGFNIKRWDIQERNNFGGKRCSAVFDKNTSIKMLDYIGKPINGFEYKWGEKVSQL